MDHVIRYRHNIMQADSVEAFAGLKGGCHQNCRDVYFVRSLGCGRNLVTDVRQMEQILGTSMREGRLLYKRLRQLPPVTDAAQAEYYTGCYETWMQSGQQTAQTRVSGRDKVLSGVLGRACQTVLRLFETCRTGAGDSVRKNFVVKLFYWYDAVMDGFLRNWDEKSCIKIVAVDVTKEQEYLFFYMLTLTGCDVLLLQTKADLKAAPELLKLSGTFVSGAYGACTLPDYEEEIKGHPSPVQEKKQPSGYGGSRTEETVSVHIPKRAGNVESSRKEVSVSGAPVRIHIPERAGRTGGPDRSGEPGQTSAGRDGQQDSRSGEPGQPVRICIPARERNACGLEEPGQPVRMQVPQRHRSPRQNSQKQPSVSRPSVSGRSRTAEHGAEVVEKSFEELAMLGSSVVMIAIHDRLGEVIGTGSGIMAGPGGYILTNNHVAAGGSFYSIRIENDDTVYRTDEVIKYHPVFDLALLRIDRQLDPVPVYQGRKKLVRGQKVVAIGSPLGLFNSVSDGIISGFRTIDNVDMIQFTAPISSGSSGGAVLNMAGEVIGISTAGFDHGQNINLAVSYECINMFIRGFV